MPASHKDNDEKTNQATEAARAAARTVADETANASQHVAHAGAVIAERSTETVQQIMQSTLEMAAQAAERSVEQFVRAFGFSGEQAEETARQSSRNIEAIAETSTVLAQGYQDISREWSNLVQNRFQRNLNGFNELWRCRTLPDLAAVQSRLLRENLELLVNNSRRLAEMSVQVADQATQKIAEEDAKHAQRAA